MNALEKYRKYNVYSQNGEDGVVAEILRRLGIETGWFCEFGAWDGKYGSNCYALLRRGWRGVMIEGDTSRFELLKKTARQHDGKLHARNAFVEIGGNNSLDNLLSDTPIPLHFEVLSIDIDGSDFHVWNSLQNYKPICVIIEIDLSTPPGEEYIYNGSGRLTSFSAMLKLGVAKGYTLVCHTGNMVFVDNKYVERLNLPADITTEPGGLFARDWVNPSRMSVVLRKLRHLTWQRVLCKADNMFNKRF